MSDPEQIDELRRMLSGYSHRCRNSLNGMKMSLYLFRREAGDRIPPTWGDLEQTYQQIETLFDHLQLIYRPMTLTMVRSSLGPLIRDRAAKWPSSLQGRGRTLQLDPPAQEEPGDFDPNQLGMGLDALASWRAEAAEPGTQTRVGWDARDGSFEIDWDERPRAAHPCAAQPVDPGADVPPHSLVVPLLARILHAHGGRLDRAVDSGLRLRLRWPLFQPAS